MCTRSDLEQRKEELLKELSSIEAKLAVPSRETIDAEGTPLRRMFWCTHGLLTLALIGSGGALLFEFRALAGEPPDPYVLAALAGTAGSAVSALVSVNARFAAGLEFDDGSRYPDQEKKERFNSRLVPGLLTRPLLGAATGPLIILALSTGTLGDVDLSAPSMVALWSILAGLFAKTLLDKLRDVFKNLTGVGG